MTANEIQTQIMDIPQPDSSDLETENDTGVIGVLGCDGDSCDTNNILMITPIVTLMRLVMHILAEKLL